MALLCIAFAWQAPARAESQTSDTTTSDTTSVTEDIRCLALTIYFEARGEPDDGKRAVAHVVMNRVAHPDFPDNVCAVVRQGGEDELHRCQFSWWCDGKSDIPDANTAWRLSTVLARAVYWSYSEDPTGGALWYHATYAAPAWREAFARGPQIGEHIFYTAAEEADSDRVDPAAAPQLAQNP